MILILGGTSDSLKICSKLNELKKEYILSVTTNYGLEIANTYTDNIVVDKMSYEKMNEFIDKKQINFIIDATHPYAVEVSKNAIRCSKNKIIKYIRYERKSLLEDVDYDKAYIVDSLDRACEYANNVGTNIFVSTGSKNLSTIVDKVDKNLIVRVLPTSEVLLSCEKLGLNADNIIAMKGPFNKEINQEFYKHYNIDLVLTKESGVEGGFLEKVESCKELDIPIVIISRDTIDYPNKVQNVEDVELIINSWGY